MGQGPAEPENEGGGPKAAGRKVDGLKVALSGMILIGVAAVLYVIVQASFKPADGPADIRSFARGELAKLTVPAALAGPPAVGFRGPDGAPVTVADFKGEVVVVNLWATWCAPCVAEMPTLARLQAAYAAQDFKVVTVSVDRESDEADARAFIARHQPLRFYHDPKFAFAFGLEPRAMGMPTTILYDRKGQERARLSGEADWSSPEARALIERLLRERS